MVVKGVVGTARRITSSPVQDAQAILGAAQFGIAGLKDGSTIAFTRSVTNMIIRDTRAKALSTAQKVVIVALPRIMALPGGDRLAGKAMSAVYREERFAA